MEAFMGYTIVVCIMLGLLMLGLIRLATNPLVQCVGKFGLGYWQR